MSDETPGVWKEQIRTEFERWLAQQPDQPPTGEGGAPDLSARDAASDGAGDLLTVIGELTALKQEVRGLGRASARLVAAAEQTAERTAGEARALADDLRAAGREALQRARLEAEKPLLLEIGDLREALREIEARTRAVGGARWRPWRRPSPAADGQGSALGVLARRLDSILTRQGVVAVGVAGDVFDARRMVAAGVTRQGRVAPGAVGAVVRVGFEAGGSLLRPAEVIVEEERAT